MDKIWNILAVGLGGALGSMARYCITLLFAALNWSGNLGIMLVNIVGSFAIGYLTGSVKDSTMLLLLTTGFCGGFTTFSTFSMQSVKLFQEGRVAAMGLYIAASVLICILCAGCGYYLAKR